MCIPKSTFVSIAGIQIFMGLAAGSARQLLSLKFSPYLPFLRRVERVPRKQGGWVARWRRGRDDDDADCWVRVITARLSSAQDPGTNERLLRSIRSRRQALERTFKNFMRWKGWKSLLSFQCLQRYQNVSQQWTRSHVSSCILLLLLVLLIHGRTEN